MNLLSQNNGPIPMPLLSIGTATDITNSTYICDSDRVVRITAITDSRIWHFNGLKEGNGYLLPIGGYIDMPTFNGWSIEVQGNVNIMRYN